jgi:hypothetical protein
MTSMRTAFTPAIFAPRALRSVALLTAWALLALVRPAFAFDTGPHFDITEDVLRSEEFMPYSIKTAQCANFMVDFYEFSRKMADIKFDVKVAKLPPLDQKCRAAVESVLVFGDAQHFDDLDSTANVARKWDAMLYNTQRYAEARVRMNPPDVLGLLTLLGMSLHNVQDFYAHSNWVEGGATGPPLGKGALAAYGDHPTWLSMSRKDRESLDVYTLLRRGAVHRGHGNWDSPADSLNKDWSGRPHHDDAYVCAWFATRQWVRLFRRWVNDEKVWNQMQEYGAFAKVPYDPGRDWDYSRKISFYGGHWNGNGGPDPDDKLSAFRARTAATSPDLLAGAVLGYFGGRCMTDKRSALRAKAEELLLTWGRMPYAGPRDPTLPSSTPELVRFVHLQMHRIEKTKADDGFLGRGMDWYGRAWISGQSFWTCLIDQHDNFDFHKPPYGPWNLIKSVGPRSDEATILFELMDLDYEKDDQVDVNPRAGAQGLLLRYTLSGNTLRGDVTGSPTFVAEGKGDGDRARITMSVDELSGSCLK